MEEKAQEMEKKTEKYYKIFKGKNLYLKPFITSLNFIFYFVYYIYISSLH